MIPNQILENPKVSKYERQVALFYSNYTVQESREVSITHFKNLHGAEL
jgi:hypothetical protein